MASKASIIPISILLLITCCNSLPVELLDDNLTSEYESTISTEKPYDSSTLDYEFPNIIHQIDDSLKLLDDGTTSVERVSDSFILEDESSTHAEPLYDSSTQHNESSTSTTVAVQDNEVDKKLVSNEESTNSSTVNDDIASDKSTNHDQTTPDQGEYPDDVSISSTTDEYLSVSSSPLIYTSEIISSGNGTDEIMVEQYSATTGASNTGSDQSSVITSDIQIEEKLSTTLSSDSVQDETETEAATDNESPVVDTESNVSEDTQSVDSSYENVTEFAVPDQSEEKPAVVESDNSTQPFEISDIEQLTTTVSDATTETKNSDEIQLFVDEDMSDD